ncbi:MAG: twin-arginine translocation signal domain-containing protein [Syntrophobacteraceae bacterium]|nr:twin-arginine translocation signal domain-containing protein [Syntrophobacteraceae bacterium]
MKQTRREFLSRTAMIGAGGVLGYSSITRLIEES